MMTAGEYTAEEMITLIKAWKDGEQIEWYNGEIWQNANDPSWNFDEVTYRSKPKTEYTPFTNNDLLLGRAVQELGTEAKRLIVYQDNKGVSITKPSGAYYVDYTFLLKNYKFTSGDPICGRCEC